MSLKTPEVSQIGDSLLLNEETEKSIEYFKNELKDEYDKLPEFLEFHSSFPQTGKQGVLGILNNKNSKRKYVYKISQYLNFLMNHEYYVMEGLNEIRNI